MHVKRASIGNLAELIAFIAREGRPPPAKEKEVGWAELAALPPQAPKAPGLAGGFLALAFGIKTGIKT